MSGSRRVPAVLVLILATAGMAIAGYLLWEHRTCGEMLGCTANARLDCNAVNRSVYSEFKGIPLAVFGLGFYAAVALLALRWVVAGAAAEGAAALIALLCVPALAVDGSLGFAQVVRIQHYCPWCIATYALTLLILAACAIALRSVARARQSLRNDWQALGRARPLLWALVALGAIASGVVIWRPPPLGLASVCFLPHLCTNAAPPCPPPSPREIILRAPIADPGPGKGFDKGTDKPVLMVVEFGDLECPACRHFSWGMDDFAAKHPGEVRWVFRHFPLDNLCNRNVPFRKHEFACAAARAAEAAGMQGKFWEYVADLYRKNDDAGVFISTPKLDDASLEDRAKKLGLDVEKWKADKDSDAVIHKIIDDTIIGGKMKIESTPTLFVNGRKVSGGSPPSSLEVWLEMARKGELPLPVASPSPASPP